MVLSRVLLMGVSPLLGLLGLLLCHVEKKSRRRVVVGREKRSGRVDESYVEET